MPPHTFISIMIELGSVASTVGWSVWP